MVGISVAHSVGCVANFVEVLLSTNATVFGAVPCATCDVGVSLPVVKIGTIWSNSLMRLVSIGCSTPVGNTFLVTKYSMSAIS
jgi:hypothetical protein